MGSRGDEVDWNRTETCVLQKSLQTLQQVIHHTLKKKKKKWEESYVWVEVKVQLTVG